MECVVSSYSEVKESVSLSFGEVKVLGMVIVVFKVGSCSDCWLM
jgi:hypothetical protein